MNVVTVREPRNHGGEVLTRVARGETVMVTRDGAEVAELRPLRRRSVPTVDLIRHRAGLPWVDPEALRRDIDATLDPTL
jgi:prevent-host-death family protein